MKRSTERVLTTHAGRLPRPDDLWEMLIAKDNGQSYDQEAFARRLRSAVAEVVKKQIDSGIDMVNDDGFGKTNFSRYIFKRLIGFVARPPKPEDRPSMIFGRDMMEFPEYF